MPDELIKIPAFLPVAASTNGIMPRCAYCTEVACETSAMACGQCSGQSCTGQCNASQCSQGCSQGCSQSCSQGCSQSCSESCSQSCSQTTVPTSININSVSTGQTSVTASITFSSAYTVSGLFVRLRFNGSSYVDSPTYSMSAGQSRTISLTKTGLTPGTTYTVEAILYNGASQVLKDTTTATTQEDLPSSSITDVGKDYVTVYVDHGTGYNYFHIFVRRASSSTAVKDPWVTKTSSFSYTVSGLTKVTDYIINVGFSTVNGTDQRWTGAQSFTTTGSRVEPWSWDIANATETSAASATAAQTRKAYTALATRGKTSDFAWQVWNDLVNKANEVMLDRGSSWDTTYGTLAATRMTASDKRMTAARFNAVWWNISHAVSTGLSKAVTGNIIYGSYFVTLADAVNRSIA